MRRKLLLLNIALLGLVSLLGWTLRERWQNAKAHERTVLSAKVHPAAAPSLPPAPTVAPALPDKYADVAQKMLFAKDRNPTVIPDPKPPVQEKPVPPFPVAHGAMVWPGLPSVIIFSEKGKADQRSYHEGEKVGEFQIDQIASDHVVLEWDGKKFDKKLSDLEDNSAPAAGAAKPPQQVADAPPPPVHEQPEPESGPGSQVSENYRACTSKDKSPEGTVMDGYQKKIIRTPMGNGCQWERVQQ
ncbi:MAG TPA: hypothetical protein VFA04_14185 [Bryobacteraceae bacterium]|nr:hypothetical protein [Bryobacteraceae bacterium]